MARHSLKTRFAILLAALGVVVAINIATMLWGLAFLERQLDEPMRATERALSLLSTAKRAAGTQYNDIARGTRVAAIGPAHSSNGDGSESIDRVALLELSDEARQAAADLIAAERLEVVLGQGVPRYLARSIARAEDAVRTWLDTGDDADRDVALGMLFDIHERIEATETLVIENAQRASSHTDDVRKKMLLSLAGSVAIAVLSGVLAVQLVRRWVLLQVTELRVATERFARGELGYRVEVRGKGELAELAAEFNAMAGTISSMQAERIERERLAAFGTATSRIIHNIKSPLSGIRMMAELAESEPDAPQRTEQLSRIISTVDRVNVWLKRLLDLTRPEQLNRVRVNPGEWLEESLASLADRAGASGIELSIDGQRAPDAVSIDPSQLEQAIVALVSNAIEVTPSGGAIRVHAWSENGTAAPGTWGIDVEDGGPGVPPEVEGNLFQPYFTTKSQGNGIGLAMVQKVAKDHGGDAWLRDAGVGRGAVFAVSLPVE